MSISLRALIKQGRDPQEAAGLYLNSLDDSLLRAELKPYLIKEARQIKRELSRYKERQFRPAMGPAGSLADRTPDQIIDDVLAKLMDSVFKLSDGSEVTWGEATVDQHLDSAARYRKFAADNEAQAVRHEETAERLRMTGARCLGELYGVAA